MSENDIALMEIEMFNKNINIFVEASKVYSKRNIKIKGDVDDQNIKKNLNENLGFENDIDYLQVGFFTEIPKEILMSLYDIIQNFIQICETHNSINQFSDIENDFISGVKFVNNVIKHKKKDFNITDLIVPNFKVETQNDNLVGYGIFTIPVEQVEFRLGTQWVEIKSEISNEMKKKHFPNYKKYLQELDVIDTIIAAKNIVDCHIAK